MFIFFHSSTCNNAHIHSQRCIILPRRLWYPRSSLTLLLLTTTVTLAALFSTMISPIIHTMYQPMADANFIVAITSVACNRLILSLRGMGFTKGPIRAFDMFDNSGRPRLEGGYLFFPLRPLSLTPPIGQEVTRRSLTHSHEGIPYLSPGTGQKNYSPKKPSRHHYHRPLPAFADDCKEGAHVYNGGQMEL
jgi:hypothetical protein